MAKTWEVRSMDEAARDMAVQAAKRADQTVAEWLGHAIRKMVADERREVGEVIRPDEPEPTSGQGVPTATTATSPDWSPLDLLHGLQAYEHVMRMRGKEIPKRGKVLVAAERTLRERLLLAAPERGERGGNGRLPRLGRVVAGVK